MWAQTVPDELANTLRSLPADDRMPHILAAVGAGWTPAAIARVIDVEPSTLRRHIKQARARGVKPARKVPNGPEDGLMPFARVAEQILADRRTVYRWAKQGIIPSTQRNGQLLVDRWQAEAWLAAHPELDRAHADEWMDSTEAADALGLTWHGLYWRIEREQVDAVQLPSGRWRIRAEKTGLGVRSG